MTNGPVTYELRDKVAVIRMDDGKANALSYELMEAVLASLARAEGEASGVVLAGRPGRFSAGFDLREMMAGMDQARAMLTRGADFLLGLYVTPLPLVIACTGHALAGGALTVLTGDVRVGARGAFRIGLNEVQIGMPVPILAMELARDRLERSALTPATLFATIYGPDEAKAAGYLDEVAAEEQVIDAAVAHAARLGKLSRLAYSKTKLSLRERTVAYIRETFASDMARLTIAPPTLDRSAKRTSVGRWKSRPLPRASSPTRPSGCTTSPWGPPTCRGSSVASGRSPRSSRPRWKAARWSRGP
jgi:enoyl-CoA hydratase